MTELREVQVLELPLAELLTLFEIESLGWDEIGPFLDAVPSLAAANLLVPWRDGVACHATLLRMMRTVREFETALTVVRTSGSLTAFVKYFVRSDDLVRITLTGTDLEPRAFVQAFDMELGEMVILADAGLLDKSASAFVACIRVQRRRSLRSVVDIGYELLGDGHWRGIDIDSRATYQIRCEDVFGALIGAIQG